MKNAKRLKQALRDLRRFQAIVRLAKHYDREERKDMNEPSRARKLITALIERGLVPSDENKSPEEKEFDQAYADSVERRIKIRSDILDRALDPNAKITSTPVDFKGVTVKVVDDEPVDVSSSVVEVIISEDSIAKRVKGDTPAEREANMQKFMESQTSDEAAVFRQTLLRTKHLGVTPRGEGQAKREVPDRSTGESEANRDGYMSGDDEFRRIDPVKFAEE